MIQKFERSPLRDTERAHRIAPLLGYDALQTWFAELDTTEEISRSRKAFSHDGETELVASLRTFSKQRMRSAAIMIERKDTPRDRTSLIGRQFRRFDDYYTPRTLEAWDILIEEEMTWRANSIGQFDLVPQCVTVGATFEPPAAIVRSSTGLTFAEAENRFFDAAEIIHNTL